MIKHINYAYYVIISIIRTKKHIAMLEREMLSLSWIIGVEKNDNPELVDKYETTRLRLDVAKQVLKKIHF